MNGVIAAAGVLGLKMRRVEALSILRPLEAATRGRSGTTREPAGTEITSSGNHPGTAQVVPRAGASADHNGFGLKTPPETTSPTPPAKRTRIPPPAVTFELADEGRVRRLIASAAAQNTTGTIAETRVLTMRSELRALLDEHGLELWRRGVDAAADKGSVAYAKAVMRNNRAGPESLFSSIHFANEGNADDAIAAARAKATRRS